MSSNDLATPGSAAVAGAPPSPPSPPSPATPQAAIGASAIDSRLTPGPQPATPKPTDTPGHMRQFTNRSTPRKSQFGEGRRSTPRGPKCLADMENYTLVDIHTAKCLVCDERNRTHLMLRCKGCMHFQICKPCQDLREKKGELIFAHGPIPLFSGPIPMRGLGPTKKLEEGAEEAKEEAVIDKANDKLHEPKNVPQAATPPNSGEKRKREMTPRIVKSKKRTIESSSDESLSEPPDSPIVAGKRQKTAAKPSSSRRDTSSSGRPPSGRRFPHTASTQPVPERKSTSSTLRNIGSIDSTGWSTSDADGMAHARAHFFGESVLKKMDGYTREGHLLARQMPVATPAGVATSDPDLTVRQYALEQAQSRYLKMQLDEQARGALNFVVRTRFKARRHQGKETAALLMSELTPMEKEELDRVLREDTADVQNQ